MKLYIETHLERNVDRTEICLKQKTFTVSSILCKKRYKQHIWWDFDRASSL